MAWKKDATPESSFDDLLLQRQKIDDEILKRQGTEAETLKTKLRNLASALGITIPDLLGLPQQVRDKEDKKQRKKRQGKTYANPDDPTQVWHGLGKRPPWLTEKLDAGANLEDFQVKPAE